MADEITFTTVYGPTEALHWYLSDREQMWSALKELIDQHGHRGTVMEWPDSQGNPSWQFEVNDYSGNRTTAVLRQHLVLVPGDQLMAYDQAVFEALNVTTEGE